MSKPEENIAQPPKNENQKFNSGTMKPSVPKVQDPKGDEPGEFERKKSLAPDAPREHKIN